MLQGLQGQPLHSAQLIVSLKHICIEKISQFYCRPFVLQLPPDKDDQLHAESLIETLYLKKVICFISIVHPKALLCPHVSRAFPVASIISTLRSVCQNPHSNPEVHNSI